MRKSNHAHQNESPIRFIEADSDDIVRSALVKAWVKLFEDN